MKSIASAFAAVIAEVTAGICRVTGDIFADKYPSPSWPKGELIISVVIFDGFAVLCRISIESVTILDNLSKGLLSMGLVSIGG